nr:hypothetical protein [Bacteroidota bacterium]
MNDQPDRQKYLEAKAGLIDGKIVTVKAIRSFDKKKNKWGWRAIQVL